MARTTLAALPLALLLLLVAAAARADGPATAAEKGAMRISAEVDVSAAGDASALIRLAFHPEDFATVKAKSPDPRRFLQDIRGSRADYETAPDMKAEYDDDGSAVVMKVTELGAAKNRGDGSWEMPLDAT